MQNFYFISSHWLVGWLSENSKLSQVFQLLSKVQLPMICIYPEYMFKQEISVIYSAVSVFSFCFSKSFLPHYHGHFLSVSFFLATPHLELSYWYFYSNLLICITLLPSLPSLLPSFSSCFYTFLFFISVILAFHLPSLIVFCLLSRFIEQYFI